MDADCWEHVLFFVELCDIRSAALTCRLFAQIVSSRSFFRGLFRRFGLSSFLENSHCLLEPLLPVPLHDEDVDLRDERSYFKYLLQLRRRAAKGRLMCDPTNLSGVYCGSYGAHGNEFVLVEQNGYRVTATKLTGDRNVPRKQLTFECSLDAFLQHAIGKIQLADDGMKRQVIFFFLVGCLITLFKKKAFKILTLAVVQLISTTFATTGKLLFNAFGFTLEMSIGN